MTRDKTPAEPFVRSDHEGGQWVLVDEYGEFVDIGERYTNFRGDQNHVTGGRPPHKPSSTGRIEAGGCEVFPSVYGLKWARWDGHLIVSGGLDRKALNMTEKAKAGDIITCKEDYRPGHTNNLTPGRDYTVIFFDENNGPEWPDGCSGSPLVTVLNDLGNEVTLIMNRFEVAFKFLERRVGINSLAGAPEGELYEMVKTTSILPQYFAKLDDGELLDLRDHNYFVLEDCADRKW